MRGRLTAAPSARSPKATRIASMQSCIGSSRFTSSSVMMIVMSCSLDEVGWADRTPEIHSSAPAALEPYENIDHVNQPVFAATYCWYQGESYVLALEQWWPPTRNSAAFRFE